MTYIDCLTRFIKTWRETYTQTTKHSFVCKEDRYGECVSVRLNSAEAKRRKEEEERDRKTKQSAKDLHVSSQQGQVQKMTQPPGGSIRQQGNKTLLAVLSSSLNPLQ